MGASAFTLINPDAFTLMNPDAFTLINPDLKLEGLRWGAHSHVDGDGLAAAIDAPPSAARQTPRAFVHALQRRSQSDLRRIVLPEGTEPRVLRAAADIIRRGLAFITLLGNHGAIQVPQPPRPSPTHTQPLSAHSLAQVPACWCEGSGNEEGGLPARSQALAGVCHLTCLLPCAAHVCLVLTDGP